MTITLQHYEVYPAGQPIIRTRTIARARRIALGFGNNTEINRSIGAFHSDGSSSLGAGGVWMVWEGRLVKDPRLNRRYRRKNTLRNRPNKRGPITPMPRAFGFSKLLKGFSS